MDGKQAAIDVGDRIVVSDPDSEYRGCHGHVVLSMSGGRTTVRLDTLQTAVVAGTTKSKDSTTQQQQQQAPVFNGALDPRTEMTGSVIGTAILNCFAAIRQLSDKTQKNDDNDSGVDQKLRSMKYAFDHWKSDDFHSALLQTEWPSTADQRILLPALRSAQAIASWHRGWVADVWVVGRNALGMYVVPVVDVLESFGVVYRLVAIRNHVPTRSLAPAMPLDPPPKLIRTPMRVQLCIVPWYGRLVYDSSLLPPAGELADAAVAHRLHSIVMRAAATANLQKRSQQQQDASPATALSEGSHPFHLVDHLAELSSEK